MNPAQVAYDRLIAAQRFVSPHERAEMKAESDRIAKQLRINRKLQKVY